MNISKHDLDRLLRVDTPTVCNAIELFEVQPRTDGYMDGRIKSRFPEMPPMVGYRVQEGVAHTGHRRDRRPSG